MTQEAEIDVSDKFACPNGHYLTEIDGQKHALPARECSAYCGMSNKETDKNWLRCKECFYKVCNNCYNCDEDHEIAVIKKNEIHQDIVTSLGGLDDLTCTSCDAEI